MWRSHVKILKLLLRSNSFIVSSLSLSFLYVYNFEFNFQKLKEYYFPLPTIISQKMALCKFSFRSKILNSNYVFEAALMKPDKITRWL